MTGVLFQRYVDDMEQHESWRVLMYAQGAALPSAGKDAWEAMLDRALPDRHQFDDGGFTWRYEGKPVSTERLKAELGIRWGQGFQSEVAGG